MAVHMTLTDIEEYSLRLNNVSDCTIYNQITVGNVTLPKAVLSTVKIFAVHSLRLKQLLQPPSYRLQPCRPPATALYYYSHTKHRHLHTHTHYTIPMMYKKRIIDWCIRQAGQRFKKNEVHAHTFKRGHVKLKTKTQQEAACTHSLAPVTKQPEPVHAQQSVIHLESLISIFFLKKRYI